MRDLIDFKTDRQRNEWEDINLNIKLKNIIILLAFYSWYFFNKRLQITDIMRSQGEQNNIYRNNPKYQKKPWKSVHQYWRGIDISTKYFDDVEIEKLLKIANTIPYDLNRPRKKTAIYHDVGCGKHLHIQVF